MASKLLAIGGVLALVLAGAGAAFVAGVGPAPGGGSGEDIESFPTETATPSGGDGGDTTATGTATDTPPFAFTIDNIEKCGETCRGVTSTLTNRQATTAEDVTVYTRIYVGNSSDNDRIWQGSERVGTLAAGESYTATRRVELSYSEAYAVEQHGGWITLQTTVETADRTVTFTEQREVA